TLASKGTNPRTEKACPEPENLKEETLGTVVDGKTLREIIPTLPFTFQFNRNLKTEYWKDMDQVLQLHKVLKDLFQWSIDNKRFNLASHWEEFGASFKKICLKKIDFKDFMIKHNVITPESNLNSDALWLQMSQYAEQTQNHFAKLEASPERMKILTASMDKIIKNVQEGYAQLSKASEETNKTLNLVFEEQHHSKRDRDFLDQEINKLFNVSHNIKPQPQGHFMDNPYHQDDIKPDAMLKNKARSPTKYWDGDNMSYSEKEASKQFPEASSWPEFSGTGEYAHMELIDYIDGLFIDVPSIPDYWITSRLNKAFKGNASIWYTEMKEIYGGRVKSSKSIGMVLGYGKRACHLKMTSTPWTKIHMSGLSDSLEDLKPLILKLTIR
ncbi:hypothetical protein O181_092528, partial [Austropuccinia psidii MF-1]|nr:hypothetical protein [Austropuccinia psidii MF-1]